MEMYLFSENCLEKMLNLAFPNTRRSAKEVINQLAPVLRELFVARVASHSLGLGTPWIAFDTFISIEGGAVRFRLKDFQRHYLDGGRAWSKRREFEATVDDFREKLPSDMRHAANGHDAVALLGLFLRNYCRKTKDMDNTKPHVLINLLACSVDLVDFQEAPMFKRLLERLSEYCTRE